MPDNEKTNQLAQLYAGMTEVELRGLAAEAWTLTEEGKQALRGELARRGLKFALATARRSPEVERSNLVMLARFRDLPEALLAKGFLESAGIESILIDQNTVRMDWLWSNMLGGVKLYVQPEDAETADRILKNQIPEKFSTGDATNFEQPRCPQCQSVDVSFEDPDKPLSFDNRVVKGAPLPAARRQWKCRSCGHVWKPSDDEESETTPNP